MNNSKAIAVDTHMVTDLVLTIENDGRLYPTIQAIHKNLSRKMERGIYDAAKAPKAFAYIVKTAAKQYAKDFGSRIPSAELKAVCESLAATFQSLYSEGETI